MLALRQRFTLIRSALIRTDESGLSLIEVVVAMMIFAIIATGALHATISTLSVTHDTRSRQVAANLAAQEIDLARDTADLLTLEDTSRDIQVNGENFHIERDARWVLNAGGDLNCGADGQTLRYKRVNISVTWDNMRPSTKPVTSDTVIDPNVRVNDPLKGTIIVKVLKPSGTGTPGVSVSATPVSGSGPSYTANNTDAQGCSYILKVEPGNYNVTVTHTGDDYVDEEQSSSSTETVGVTAGSSASAGFLFSEGGELRVNYASNSTLAGLLFPNEWDTSFLSSYPTYVESRSFAGPNTDREEDFALQPFTSGYQVLAGAAPTAADGSKGCLAVDPQAWPARKEKGKDGKTYIGKRTSPVAASSGDTAVVDVPMGIVTISGGIKPVDKTYVKAVSVDTTDRGNPGCEGRMTYLFGPLNSLLLQNPITIALPYGSWELSSGSSGNADNRIDEKKISVQKPDSVARVRGAREDEDRNRDAFVVTLDPRIHESDVTGPVVVEDEDDEEEGDGDEEDN